MHRPQVSSTDIARCDHLAGRLLASRRPPARQEVRTSLASRSTRADATLPLGCPQAALQASLWTAVMMPEPIGRSAEAARRKTWVRRQWVGLATQASRRCPHARCHVIAQSVAAARHSLSPQPLATQLPQPLAANLPRSQRTPCQRGVAPPPPPPRRAHTASSVSNERWRGFTNPDDTAGCWRGMW